MLPSRKTPTGQRLLEPSRSFVLEPEGVWVDEMNEKEQVDLRLPLGEMELVALGRGVSHPDYLLEESPAFLVVAGL